MLHFRNMVLEDINVIYENELMRPLVTVPPIGEKFGIVIDDEGKIRGGATGYIDKDKAKIQKVIVEDSPQSALLIESLLRAVIYILERHEIKTIFIDKDQVEEKICKKIGFQEWLEEESKRILFIDTSKFFERPCCSGSV